MNKIIIFDFDGVLVESVDIKTRAFVRLFEPEGKAVAEKVKNYHLKNTGVSRFEKFRFIYKGILKRDLSENAFRALCDRFSALVVEEVIKAPYVPGAKEFLDAHASCYKCYVASATPQDEIEDIIKKRGMTRYFSGIYGAPKDKDAIVKDVLEKNHISAREAVYVGDALSDYTAAAGHGVRFIARVRGDEAVFSGIDCVKINDLVDLKGTIDKL